MSVRLSSSSSIRISPRYTKADDGSVRAVPGVFYVELARPHPARLPPTVRKTRPERSGQEPGRHRLDGVAFVVGNFLLGALLAATSTFFPGHFLCHIRG